MDVIHSFLYLWLHYLKNLEFTVQVYHKYRYQRFGKVCCLNPGGCLRRALRLSCLWPQLASVKRRYLWTTNQHGMIYLQCEPRIQLVESKVCAWISDGRSYDDCSLGRSRRFGEHCCWWSRISIHFWHIWRRRGLEARKSANKLASKRNVRRNLCTAFVTVVCGLSCTKLAGLSHSYTPDATKAIWTVVFTYFSFA